jgi:hypothetical protein
MESFQSWLRRGKGGRQLGIGEAQAEPVLR